MATNTPTYSFLKPTVGGDTSVWGGYLNTNFDDIDGLLDGTSPVTGIDINGGSIDGTPIGAAVASTGAFSTLTGTTINGVIGSVTPAAGTFSTLTGTTINGVIGSVTPAAGTFTSLTGTTLRGPGTSLAATPEISFSNDTNTGIYRVGADTLGISTGGGLRASIGSTDFAVTTGMTVTGNATVAASVGIGTVTPDSKLDIDTNSASATAITLQAAAATSAKLQMGLGMFSAGYPTVLGSANGLDLGTSISAPIRLFTNSTQVGQMTASGALVVGATDPSFGGAVAGDIVATRGVNVTGTYVVKSKRISLTTSFQDVLVFGPRASYKIEVGSCDASTGGSTGMATLFLSVDNTFADQGNGVTNVTGTLVNSWKAGDGFAEINRTLQMRTTVASSESYVATVTIYSDYARTTEGTGVGSCQYLI